MLSGINKLCEKCIHSCKQFKQVVIVKCPFFKRKEDDNNSKDDNNIKTKKKKSL